MKTTNSEATVSLCELIENFDEEFYASQNPGPEVGQDLISHYLATGWLSGLDPAPWFSSTSYISTHEDVRNAQINPFLHFLKWGRAESRTIAPSDCHTNGKSIRGGVASHDGRSIVLVTEELPGFGLSGGIGAAVVEIAAIAGAAELPVVIAWIPPTLPDEATRLRAREYCQKNDVKLVLLDPLEFATSRNPQTCSFAVYRFLRVLESPPVCVIFPDFGGLGFHTVEAKLQGVGFLNTKLIVHLHGSTRWATEANRLIFSDEDELIRDFLEQRSLVGCDEIIAASEYILDWTVSWIPVVSEKPHRVLRNPIQAVARDAGSGRIVSTESEAKRSIIIFGRHEERKGLRFVCRALTELDSFLSERQIEVVFLGQYGEIGGVHSAIYLDLKSKNWHFNWSIISELDRYGAETVMASLHDPVVVVASAAENAPYAIIEPLNRDLRVIASNRGGGYELFDERDRELFLFDPDSVKDFERVLTQTIADPCTRPRLKASAGEVITAWREFLSELMSFEVQDYQAGEFASEDEPLPAVTVGITHFGRPGSVVHAVRSICAQDYEGSIRIVVYDDGSLNPFEAKELGTLFHGHGIEFIQGKNAYLGAARNRILSNVETPLVIFLDDDDVALPGLIRNLVRARETSGATVVSALPIFTNYQVKVLASRDPDGRVGQMEYLSLSGPISLAPRRNLLGGSVALHETATLRAVGGYTEDYEVGYEDFEILVRYAALGYTLKTFPEPLFLYEGGRPSMVSTVGAMQSQARVMRTLASGAFDAELKDLAFLNAGEAAKRDQHARYGSRFIGMPGEEQLRKLHEVGASSLQRISALNEYLRIDDTSEISAAISRGNRMVRQAHQSKFISLRSDFLDRDVASLVLAIEDERSEALRRFVSSRSKLHFSSLEALSSVQWGEIENVNPRVLLARVLRCADGEDPDIDLALYSFVACFSIDLGLKQDFEWALTRLAKAEALEYEVSNPDVASGVPEYFVSVAEHYLNHGRREGRPGFRRTQELLTRDVLHQMNSEMEFGELLRMAKLV